MELWYGIYKNIYKAYTDLIISIYLFLIGQDKDELLATIRISKYFPDSPAEEHIHVLVEAPETTATSSREQELLDQVASLQALLNKSTHGTTK